MSQLATDADTAFDPRLPRRLVPVIIARPRIKAGKPTVMGKLPAKVISRIARQNHGRIRLCYEDGLRRNEHLRGRVMVRFVIGQKGRVSNTTASGDLPDAAVISCIARAMSNVLFPTPEAGVVRVSLPFEFAFHVRL